MAETVVLHNPRCSKSRQTCALLRERGIAFEERLYLEQPLSLEELRTLRDQLDAPPSAWLRSGEAAYASAGLSADSSEESLLQAIASQPILLQRPVVIHNGRARLGRPPEAVLELFV